MDKTYKIKVTSVYYAVEDEDICHLIDENLNDEEWQKEADRIRNDIISHLPQQLELEVTCDEESIGDLVADAISEETFWLIHGCEYQVIN